MSDNHLTKRPTPNPHPFLKPLSYLRQKLSPTPAGKITYKAIPQWKWSQTDNRVWLAEYMIEKGGADRKDALLTCMRYSGKREQGEMYYLSKREWRDILGEEMGKLVFKRLQRVKNRPGTTPILVMDREGNVELV